MSYTQQIIKFWFWYLLLIAPLASIVAANAEALTSFGASGLLFIMSIGWFALSLWEWIGHQKEHRKALWEYEPLYFCAMLFLFGLYVANFGAIGFFTSYLILALSPAIPALIKMINKSRGAIAEAREVSEAQQPPQQQITGPRRDAD